MGRRYAWWRALCGHTLPIEGRRMGVVGHEPTAWLVAGRRDRFPRSQLRSTVRGWWPSTGTLGSANAPLTSRLPCWVNSISSARDPRPGHPMYWRAGGGPTLSVFLRTELVPTCETLSGTTWLPHLVHCSWPGTPRSPNWWNSLRTGIAEDIPMDV